jgi:hypothetical protein
MLSVRSGFMQAQPQNHAPSNSKSPPTICDPNLWNALGENPRPPGRLPESTELSRWLRPPTDPLPRRMRTSWWPTLIWSCAGAKCPPAEDELGPAWSQGNSALRCDAEDGSGRAGCLNVKSNWPPSGEGGREEPLRACPGSCVKKSLE